VSALKIVALLLIAAGIIGLVYGGITYTRATHNARVGPFELSIKHKETVNIPVWAGVGAILIGGILLFVRTKET
jgi:TRAP-type C4-dicarboxylate transport system permease small subunit